MASSEAPDGADQPKKTEKNENERRSFLRVALAASAVLLVGGIAALARSLSAPEAQIPSGTGTTTTQTGTGTITTQTALAFPRIKVGNASDLAEGKPVFFNYPLDETPNVLVKLGVAAEGGVGPNSDIVAYSVLCQHLGCVYGFVDKGASPKCDSYYVADSPVGYCCCHGSIFDLVHGGTVLDGPSPRPAPQVILEADPSTGDIFATGMKPPAIFGHDTGSNDVFNDLKGGTLVS